MTTWTQIILNFSGLLLQVAQEPIVVQQAANWTSIMTAFVVGLPATIAAIVSGMSLLQSRRNAEVAARTDAKVEATAGKADTIIEKATEIHTLTNSNLSKVQSQLEVSNRTIEGLNQAQVESVRRIASMERLIVSLIPPKGEQTSSQTNSDKLDDLRSMLNDVQHGTPPIPVKDEAVLKKLEEVAIITDRKLDTIQEATDVAAQQTPKESQEE